MKISLKIPTSFLCKPVYWMKISSFVLHAGEKRMQSRKHVKKISHNRSGYRVYTTFMLSAFVFLQEEYHFTGQ